MSVFDYIEKELDRIEVGYTSYDGTKITLTMDEVRELVRNLRKKYQPDGDTIYRSDAIEAAKDWYDGLICGSFRGLEKRLKSLPPAQPEITLESAIDYLHSIGWMQTHDKQMYEDGQNHAQSEPQWIPCSERLPEDEYVLISKKPTKLSGSKWCVTIAIRMADPRSRKVDWRDIGFNVIQDDEVLAWMPLPEPYRGE